MKLSALLTVTAIASIAAPAAANTSAVMSSLHLRIHAKDVGCTIPNESQCGGQNWSGSTCCVDSNYECRADDNGGDVQRCQKKATASSESPNSDNIVYVDDFETCMGANEVCTYPTSTCVYYDAGHSYAECKPATLPSGALCGQHDGTNEWVHPHCPDGEACFSDAGMTVSYCHELVYELVDDFLECSGGNQVCKNAGSTCQRYGDGYAECKSETLPSGALCGQHTASADWEYHHCPAGETCYSDAGMVVMYCH